MPSNAEHLAKSGVNIQAEGVAIVVFKYTK